MIIETDGRMDTYQIEYHERDVSGTLHRRSEDGRWAVAWEDGDAAGPFDTLADALLFLTAAE